MYFGTTSIAEEEKRRGGGLHSRGKGSTNRIGQRGRSDKSYIRKMRRILLRTWGRGRDVMKFSLISSYEEKEKQSKLRLPVWKSGE